jgi:hypothetical protein
MSKEAWTNCDCQACCCSCIITINTTDVFWSSLDTTKVMWYCTRCGVVTNVMGHKKPCGLSRGNWYKAVATKNIQPKQKESK